MKQTKPTPSALFIIMLCLGLLLSWVYPWHLTSYINVTVVRWTGVIILIASLIVNILAYRVFKKSLTPHAPYMKPRVLITNSVFSFSRNPVYLALIFSQSGLAFIFDSLWILFSSVMLWIALDMVIVRPEEKVLEKSFKNEYENYKNMVRRWL